jgi:hypothetical protein
MKIPAPPVLLLGIIGFAIVAAGQVLPPPHDQPSKYQVCDGYFALCTLAKCGSPPAKGATFLPTTYSCTGCYILNGPSVAAVPPAPACMLLSKNPGAGKNIQSRFAMMDTVTIANCNKNPIIWANCLNATCTVDSGAKTATCTCPAQSATLFVSGKTPIIPPQCSGNPVISSESQTDASAISAFWSANGLQSFPAPPPQATPAKK